MGGKTNVGSALSRGTPPRALTNEIRDLIAVYVMKSQTFVTCLLVIAAASTTSHGPPLPKYAGPKPPWPYKGYEKFPAVWFGQNRSGLDSAEQMDLEAKHQIVGWGWQQNFHTVAKYTDNATTGTGRPCNRTTCLPNGTIYQQETSLAQMASRFAAFREFSPPNPAHQTQGVFVYRHMEVAESVCLFVSRCSRRWLSTTGVLLRQPSTTLRTPGCSCTTQRPVRSAGRATIWPARPSTSRMRKRTTGLSTRLDSWSRAVFFDGTYFFYFKKREIHVRAKRGEGE